MECASSVHGRNGTPLQHRRPAMQAYIIGEAALDAADIPTGVDSMKQAFSLAPELEAETWPRWATELHYHLSNDVKPTLLAEDEAVLPARLQSARIDSTDDLAAICTSLETHNFAIVDHFMGSTDAARLRASCSAACSSMQPARQAGTRR